jgi:hypothetical protein
MQFIQRQQIPPKRRVSYYNPQVKVKIKDGTPTYRVRGTYGGNLSDYPYAVTAFTADLQTIKILLNATATENHEWMTADAKDFYLGTPLPHAEYMRIHRTQVPSRTIIHYNLADKFENDFLYVKINKGIYGLKQAGKLAQDQLMQHLASHGYRSSPDVPCLFKHDTLPISFVLVVDDFGISYRDPAHARHLLDILNQKYTITEDWTGSKYVGLHIARDRTARTITLSMPGYIQRACKRFNIDPTHRKVHNPMVYTPPKYGTTGPQEVTDTIPDPTTDPPLTKDEITTLQQILGVLLYYARAVDHSLLTALNKLSSEQAAPTASTLQAAYRILHYADTYPDAKITFFPSTMQLVVHSDASYNSERNARSRAGGIFFLPRLPTSPYRTSAIPHPTKQPLLLNGLIDASTTIIRTVVASACEAEYAALFHNCQQALSLRLALDFLGYPQKPTSIISDNLCAVNIANGSAKPKKSKSMNMRYHWVRDQLHLHLFSIAWAPGEHNLADFFTKTVPNKQHLQMRKLLCTPLFHPVVSPCQHVPVQEGVLDNLSTTSEQDATTDNRHPNTNGIFPHFQVLDFD